MPVTALVGALAVAATTGALVAFGRRLGSVGLPFAATGATLLHRTPTGFSAPLVAAGLVAHVVSIFFWSAAFVRLVRDRAWRPMPAALAIVVVAHVVSWVTAWSTGSGVASVLPLGDRLVLAAILALALVAGIRFAFFAPRDA